jgi:Ca2+-binding EF-hand superfamily protein
MKHHCIIALLLAAPLISSAASNSKGADSPIVVGTIVSVSADGKTFTVKQGKDIERKLVLSGKAKPNYVGIPDDKERQPKPGYGVKAKVTPGGSEGDMVKNIQLTQPLTPVKPLGPTRLTMTPAQIYAAVDANHDNKLSYVEFSASMMRSEKHGPDHYVAMDNDKDGSLDIAEFTEALPHISWWKYSRKPSAAWFKEADTDADAKINLTEFELLSTAKNHTESHFKRADKNSDGSLDAAETTAYLKDIVEKLDGDDE